MKLLLTEDLAFTTLLNPPSREETESQLRTKISLILVLIFALKKKEPQRNENEEQKKALTKLPRLFLFVEKAVRKSNQ